MIGKSLEKTIFVKNLTMSSTLFIIILTILVSFTAFRNRLAFERMKFNAYEIRVHRSFYRFLSYGLLHADWMHLLVNMFVLFSFGTVVERILEEDMPNMGNIAFIGLYATSMVASTLPSYLKHRRNYYYNAVGASGAVSAVLFASIILHPQGNVFLMFIPIPIPSFIFGLFYLAYSFYMAKRGKDNVGHDVHFWGAVYGILFVALLDPQYLVTFFRFVF